MEVFTDKLILLGFCMFLLLGVNEAREPVIAFLFAVIAGALGNYIRKTTKIRAVRLVFCVGSCLADGSFAVSGRAV